MSVVYGVGIREDGVYPVTVGGKHSELYTLWKNMLARCYSPAMNKHRPTYESCEVSGDFLNFQKFASWYSSKAADGQAQYQLDKDLKNRGNKIYSEDTCLLIPRKVNMFLCNSAAKRGEYPLGVSLHKQTGKYIAQVADSIIGGRCKRSKLCATVAEAFDFYKNTKESIARELASIYKGKCDDMVIEALLNYKVDIND